MKRAFAGLVIAMVLSTLTVQPVLAAPVGQLSEEDSKLFESTIESLAEFDDPAIDEIRKEIPVPGRAVAIGSVRAPRSLEGKVGTGKIINEPPSDDGLGRVQTVFGRDDRQVVRNTTAYPFNAVGLVENAVERCSGALIGPRHVLTASHCVKWNGDGSFGWMKFSPGYQNGWRPYGYASAQRIYYFQKSPPPVVTSNYIANDYVVVVLDRPIGNITGGWLGVRNYSPIWNRSPRFQTIGYPGDMGKVQVTERNCSIDWTQSFALGKALVLGSQCDIFAGQSGSPVFSYWGTPALPYAVGVVSAENPIYNSFAGGSRLMTLVTKAFSENP